MKPVALPTYTDEQVTTATGLHIDNLRKLITWGAVKPAQAGGGRGRVRMWTTRQALRIAVTAQIAEAGFSLQMAHTLTYCLPLDDLLYLYDPEMLEKLVAQKDDQYDRLMLSSLTEADGLDGYPGERWLGSRTIILDGRYLYTDALGDSPTLFAVIDPDRQRVYPDGSPFQFRYGAGMAEDLNLPKISDATEIDRASLLIDDRYLVRRRGWKPLPKSIQPPSIQTQIGALEEIIARTLLVINLALGLLTCVRKLRNLPIPYHPHEIPYADR